MLAAELAAPPKGTRRDEGRHGRPFGKAGLGRDLGRFPNAVGAPSVIPEWGVFWGRGPWVSLRFSGSVWDF